MRPETGDDPRDRMGAFKHLSDVPDKYRLDTPEVYAAFEGRDVWAEWTIEDVGDKSARYHKDAERVDRTWKEHCEERGVHHALATPEDVNTYVGGLLDGRKTLTVYMIYWTKLDRFFRWMMYHADYPHLYNPVLMSAAEYPEAGEVWKFKLSRRANQ